MGGPSALMPTSNSRIPLLACELRLCECSQYSLCQRPGSGMVSGGVSAEGARSNAEGVRRFAERRRREAKWFPVASLVRVILLHGL